MTPQRQLDAVTGVLAWGRLEDAGLVKGERANVPKAIEIRDRLLAEGYAPTQGAELAFVASVLEGWGLEAEESKREASKLWLLLPRVEAGEIGFDDA